MGVECEYTQSSEEVRRMLTAGERKDGKFGRLCFLFGRMKSQQCMADKIHPWELERDGSRGRKGDCRT